MGLGFPATLEWLETECREGPANRINSYACAAGPPSGAALGRWVQEISSFKANKGPEADLEWIHSPTFCKQPLPVLFGAIQSLLLALASGDGSEERGAAACKTEPSLRLPLQRPFSTGDCGEPLQLG